MVGELYDELILIVDPQHDCDLNPGSFDIKPSALTTELSYCLTLMAESKPQGLKLVR